MTKNRLFVRALDPKPSGPIHSWDPSHYQSSEEDFQAARERVPTLWRQWGAWVDVVPGWLSGSGPLFEDLLAQAAWREREVPMYDQVLPEPRLTCWWGDGEEHAWPTVAHAMAAALGARYGTRFDALGANLYRDGSDSVAWHGDRVLREQETALVAVLTLGCARRFLLRPKGGGPSLRLRPGPGDLLVMGGTCQRTWQHCVPKTAHATGPRVSVTLRPRRSRPTATA